VGNSSNALVVVTKPDNGDGGIYAHCVGPAARGLAPMSPKNSSPLYGETDAFFELKLAGSPEGLTAYVRQKAQEYIEWARAQMGQLNRSNAAYEPLQALLVRAESEFAGGQESELAAGQANGHTSTYAWARATRAYTRAQVRALQVYQALVPPPNKPEDLGL